MSLETHRVFQKEKFLRIYDQTDPYDCPFVGALRRLIPEEFWLNIWMFDDYIVHLQSPEGREKKDDFGSALQNLERAEDLVGPS
jgi:hypothetical protein